MSTIKQIMTDIIQSQPEDSSYEEIIRELAFERMIEKGLLDSKADRIISNSEMKKRINQWNAQ